MHSDRVQRSCAAIVCGDHVHLWLRRSLLQSWNPNPFFRSPVGDVESVRDAWGRIYTHHESNCVHAGKCGDPACTKGRRLQHKEVLTGAVLPYWKHVEKVVGFEMTRTRNKDGDVTTKQVSNMRIVRVRAEDASGGEVRLGGVLIQAAKLTRLHQLLAGGEVEEQVRRRDAA